MEISIIKLMQNLGVIPPEVGKVMEQSAAQRGEPQQQQQPQPLQGQAPQFVPGMMPSNNPMDMLQMQQQMQMQQTFGIPQQNDKK